MIRVVDHVVLVLTVLFEVVEGDCVTLNAHLFDEIAKIAPRALMQVLEQTERELGVVLHGGVRGQLLFDFVSHDVLISEHVSDSALVNWHALLISVVESLVLMSVTILHVEMLSLGQLGDLLKWHLVDSLIHEILCEDLVVHAASMSVLDQMQQSSLLIVIQATHAFNKFPKFFFRVLVGLIPRLCGIVEMSNEVLELLRVGVDVLKQIFI